MLSAFRRIDLNLAKRPEAYKACRRVVKVGMLSVPSER